MKRGTPDHPKTLWLKAGLGLTRLQVVGLLELLFHFTARCAPQGDIGKWSDQQIAEGVDWTGDPVVLVRTLVDSGFLDEDKKHRLLVHDWEEHADGALKKQMLRAGLAFIPTSAKRRTNGSRAASARPTAVPGLAVPGLAKPEPPNPPEGASAVADQVVAVFDHWREVMEHPDSKLTPKRKRLIQARLREGYTAYQLLEAIDGCRASPFHQGANDRQMRYDDLTLICRDGEHIEQFRRLVAGAAAPRASDMGLPTLDEIDAQRAARTGR